MSAEPGLAAKESARSLFSKFRSLLEANTAALAKMAEMERMLGGEYIFDRAFLEKAARDVAGLAHQAVYAVNAMTGNRYVDLYDRYMAVSVAVEDILAGRQGPGDDAVVRPLASLRLEDRTVVGHGPAALGELAGQLGLAVPAGFVVAGAALENGRLTEAARQAVALALAHWDHGREPAVVTVAAEASAPAGQGEPFRSPGRIVSCRAEAVLPALEAALSEAVVRAGGTTGAAALVLAAPPAVLRGWVRTLAVAPEGGEDCLEIEAWPADTPDVRDTLWLARSHPFAPRRSRLARKPLDRRLPDGLMPLDPGPGGLLRGSGLLPFDAAAALAGQALAAERLLGGALGLAFSRDASGTVAFESVGLLPALAQGSGQQASEKGETMLRGGEAACLGAASGTVVHVTEKTAAASFPFGAVAVARAAAPALAPILRRAGAMVTEVGDAAGHLAAVAREFRVPALFGLPGALAALPQGLVVTVDAEAGEIRWGAQAGRPAPDVGLSPDDPEYLMLRWLLRRIAALHLIDPDDPSFVVQGCRTFHDIIHFSHEKAVAALADLRQAGVSESLARPLSLPVPLDLRVLDIGGGLDAGAEGLEAVRSRPLRAFLSGVLAPGLWDATPVRVGLREVLGNMDKLMAGLPGKEALSGGNLAIAARSYCNVSLRLGYHFSVIDAYVGENPDKNVVYFRFVGGLADAAGRAARAAFLRRVLDRFDFKVSVDGDLVVGRLKMVAAEAAEEALRLLGRITAFVRQRDVGLSGGQGVEALEAEFDAAGGRP